MTDTSDKGKMTNSNENAARGATDLFQEGSFEIKTQAEIPVISKTARIVEEVVISKMIVQRDETIRDSVKSTDVTVEKIASGEAENRRNG